MKQNFTHWTFEISIISHKLFLKMKKTQHARTHLHHVVLHDGQLTAVPGHKVVGDPYERVAEAESSHRF